jgi:hypothetical protein
LDALRQRRVKVLGLIFNRAVSSPCERQYYERYQRAYHWEPDQARRAAALAEGQASNGTYAYSTTGRD